LALQDSVINYKSEDVEGPSVNKRKKHASFISRKFSDDMRAKCRVSTYIESFFLSPSDLI